MQCAVSLEENQLSKAGCKARDRKARMTNINIYQITANRPSLLMVFGRTDRGITLENVPPIASVAQISNFLTASDRTDTINIYLPPYLFSD